MKTSPQAPTGKHEHQPPPTGRVSPLESAALFGKRDEVLIAHGDETYRLRRTRQGKLILTK
ncbi:MAG: hemin uptake protein HemP [Sulfuritalea sp.]|nr:hemin uptake protein HemP [Sulfuritalea sp.]